MCGNGVIMKIYIHHKGKKHGPLELEEVRALLEQGDLSPETKAWVEGSTDWVSLRDVPGINRVARTQPKDAAGGSVLEPMASVKGDLKNLKSNTASTAIELRQFLGEMRGQTPKEMLGTIAQSNLVVSVTVSAVCICFLLFTFTAIAYGLRVVNPVEPKNEETVKVPAVNPPGLATNAVASGSPAGTNDVLGINESKKGEPKETNPFNTKGDLLNDIK